MQRGIKIYLQSDGSACVIESILEALKNESYCYTNGIVFEGNSHIGSGVYCVIELLQMIRESDGDIQETTIMLSNKYVVQQKVPHTYEEYQRGSFNAIIDCYDFYWIDVYIKNHEFLKHLESILLQSFSAIGINSITDENDDRTGFLD